MCARQVNNACAVETEKVGRVQWIQYNILNKKVEVVSFGRGKKKVPSSSSLQRERLDEQFRFLRRRAGLCFKQGICCIGSKHYT